MLKECINERRPGKLGVYKVRREYPVGCVIDGCDIKTVKSVNASAGEDVCIKSGPTKNPSLSLVLEDIRHTLDNIQHYYPKHYTHLIPLLIPVDHGRPVL